MSVKFSRFFPLLKYLSCVIAWFWYEIETFNYAVSFFLTNHKIYKNSDLQMNDQQLVKLYLKGLDEICLFVFIN